MSSGRPPGQEELPDSRDPNAVCSGWLRPDTPATKYGSSYCTFIHVCKSLPAKTRNHEYAVTYDVISRGTRLVLRVPSSESELSFLSLWYAVTEGHCTAKEEKRTDKHMLVVKFPDQKWLFGKGQGSTSAKFCILLVTMLHWYNEW